MPIYEYQCSACSTSQERICKFAERDAPGPCEACGASEDHLEIQISHSSFRFQPGIGWDGWDKDKSKPGWVTRELSGGKAPTD